MRNKHLPLFSNPITRSEALASGATEWSLRSTRLVRPVRGLRVLRGTRPDVWEFCGALLDKLPHGAVFSHATAALLWVIPLPPRLRGMVPVQVGMPDGRTPPRGRNVRGHRLNLADDEVLRHARGVESPALPVTSPARTLFDLRCLLGVDELVAAGDSLLCGRRPKASLAQLRAYGERDGFRNIRRYREAVDLMRVGAESPKETELRLLLVRAGLPEPELNVEVHRADGSFIARVDFLFRSAGLIVEYDGDYHRIDRRRWTTDNRQRQELMDRGYRHIVVTAAGLGPNAPTTLAQIRRALERRR